MNEKQQLHQNAKFSYARIKKITNRHKNLTLYTLRTFYLYFKLLDCFYSIGEEKSHFTLDVEKHVDVG